MTRQLASRVAREASRLPDGGSPDQFFLRFDSSTGCWLFLHVTTDLTFGRHQSVAIGGADACLRRRVRVQDTWSLAGEDEFWVTLFHVLIDKGAVPQRYQVRLAELAGAATGTGPVACAIGGHCPPRWPVEDVL